MGKSQSKGVNPGPTNNFGERDDFQNGKLILANNYNNSASGYFNSPNDDNQLSTSTFSPSPNATFADCFPHSFAPRPSTAPQREEQTPSLLRPLRVDEANDDDDRENTDEDKSKSLDEQQDFEAQTKRMKRITVADSLMDDSLVHNTSNIGSPLSPLPPWMASSGNSHRMPGTSYFYHSATSSPANNYEITSSGRVSRKKRQNRGSFNNNNGTPPPDENPFFRRTNDTSGSRSSDGQSKRSRRLDVSDEKSVEPELELEGKFFAKNSSVDTTVTSEEENDNVEGETLSVDSSPANFGRHAANCYYWSPFNRGKQEEEGGDTVDPFEEGYYDPNNALHQEMHCCSASFQLPTLPLDLWNLIFGYLTLEERCIASAVSKTWNSICFSTSDLEVTLRFGLNQDRVMAGVLSKCTNLRRLVFRDCFTLTGRVIRYLPQSLQHFEFFGCVQLTRTLTISDLQYLSRVPDLISFNLKNCTHIDDDSLQYLPSTLQNLDLSSTRTAMTDIGLLTLPSSLQSLTLNGCDCAALAGHGTSSLPATLTTLNLRSCHLQDASNILAAIPASLRVLDLSFNPLLTDAALSKVLQNAPNLRVLNLEGCTKITDSVLSLLPDTLTSLSLRDCAGIKGELLSSVASPSLSSPSLHRSQEMPIRSRWLPTQSLKELDLWGCLLSRQALCNLPLGLQVLNLTLVESVDDDICSCLPPNLRALSLFRCPVTDIGVASLPRTLERLDLSWTRVTPQLAQVFGENEGRFPQLEWVCVANTEATTKSEHSLMLFSRPKQQSNTQQNNNNLTFSPILSRSASFFCGTLGADLV